MGLTFDKEIDFQYDNVDDIVKLTGSIQQMNAFGKCFYKNVLAGRLTEDENGFAFQSI